MGHLDLAVDAGHAHRAVQMTDLEARPSARERLRAASAGRHHEGRLGVDQVDGGFPGDQVDVELNTRTSIAVWPGAGGTRGIDLIAGEAAIDLSRAETPFVVAAGAGHTQALQRQAARFEVRHLDGAVCVTCIDGQVQVAHASGTVQLSGGQRLRYDDHTLGRAEQLDAARMPGWRQGYLRFTDAPLGEVLDEINRYRTGKVVLLDRQLAAKPVTGRFQIHALDKAIVQMQRSFGLHARTLPGGVVLLS